LIKSAVTRKFLTIYQMAGQEQERISKRKGGGIRCSLRAINGNNDDNNNRNDVLYSNAYPETPDPYPVKDVEKNSVAVSSSMSLGSTRIRWIDNNDDNGVSDRKGENDKDSHSPGRLMVQFWLICVIIPAAALAWVSTKRLVVTLVATVFMPILSVVQGAIGVLGHRVQFGDAPRPVCPCHGVVVVRPLPSSEEDGEKSNKASYFHNNAGEKGIQARINGSFAAAGPTSSCASSSAGVGAGTLPQQASDRQRLLDAALTQVPLRLLVIGDSFSAGVGQSQSAIPIMPETIAKTMSKHLGGRAVYWTCHGVPGKATQWVVRELEKGVDCLKTKQQGEKEYQDSYLEHDEDPARLSRSSCSETDDDLSSSEDEEEPSSSNGMVVENNIVPNIPINNPSTPKLKITFQCDSPKARRRPISP